MEATISIIAFTGAGISAASGIPTFEELGEGFRRSLSRNVFLADPDSFYNNVLKLKHACEKAMPNPAHLALAQHGVPVITMNIDGLHRRAGTTDLIEIHGSMESVHCSRCHSEYPFSQVEQGSRCPACGGLLLHDIVLYEDQIPRLHEALALVEGPGLAASCSRLAASFGCCSPMQPSCSPIHPGTLLVIGTSFYTSTASYIVDHARAARQEIVIINEKAETEVPAFLNSRLPK